jgi:hypothetical protein
MSDSSRKLIERAIAERNVRQLRVLSVASGLESDALRRRAWPLLVGLWGSESDEGAVSDSWQRKNYKVNLHRHGDFEQVALDVNRSLWRFTGNDEAQRERLRVQLATVLHCVLCNHPHLSYFQGMHDIASALLLVLGSERLTYFVMERLCMFHIRDACARNLDEIQSILWLLFPLLRLLDADVYRFVREAHSMGSLTMPIFALPWVLTLYSHSLDKLATIARLLDFFIVSHPLMPLYFAAQLICHLRSDLLALECDFPTVMKFLGALPEDRLPFDDLIMAAHRLFIKHPPATLLSLAEQPLQVMPSMLNNDYHFPDVLQEFDPPPWPSERHYARFLAENSKKAPRYVQIDGVTDALAPRAPKRAASNVADALAFSLFGAAIAAILLAIWLPKYLQRGGDGSFSWLQPHGRAHGC